MREKKKILLISCLPFGALNGETLSLLDLMKKLEKDGFECRVISLTRDLAKHLQRITVQKPAGLRVENNICTCALQGISMETVIASGKVQDVENVFRGMVYRMAPDIVFIRCPDFVSLRIIKDLRIPKYFFVHDAFSVDPKYGFVSKKDFCSLGKDVRPIAVSAFLMNKLKAISKRKARLLYPFVDKKKFLAKRTGGDRITIMNNNPYKGKIIFESLAGLFPAYRFLACKGWGKDSGGANFKNLEHMDMTNDARRILSRTKILLCPSLIDDGYPRTIVEAFLNGIPVVANKVGGIPESIGDAGHLINVRPQRKMPLDRYCSDARLHRVAVVQYAKIIDKLMEDDSYYRLWSKTAEKAYFRIEGEYQLQYKGFLKEISSI